MDEAEDRRERCVAEEDGEREVPIQSEGSLPRGRGQRKWVGPGSEKPLAGSRGERYTKSELLSVYAHLKSTSRLVVPPDARVPVTLQIEGPRVGLSELRCQDWIWITSRGGPFRVLTRPEVKEGLHHGRIAEHDVLLPMTAIEQHGIKAIDFWRIFEEQDTAKKAYLRRAAKEKAFAFGGKSLKKWIGLDWKQWCVELDCEEAVYLDSSDRPQGPFVRQRIVQWWKHGYFPERLKIRPAASDRFVQICHLLAKWLSGEESWYIAQDFERSLTREEIMDCFLAGELDHRCQLLPVGLDSAKRTLPLLYVMVHWLPVSDEWAVKEGDDIKGLSIKEAFDLWHEEYRTQSGWLLAKPVSWTSDSYMPLEHLMECYGLAE